MKLFGRDPAAWASVIEAALLCALAFGLFGLTSDQVALIMAAVSAGLGLVTAIYTKRAGLSAAIGFLKAAIALAAGYGLVLTENETTTLIGLATVVLGLFNWSHNSPAEQPGFREE
jgi:hypothetical protein